MSASRSMKSQRPAAAGGRRVSAVLADAQLPAELETLVRDTVRRTGLRRAEQAEIAAELAADLRSGLEAGRSAQELIKGFGDPAAAALLLRRAVRRRRSPIDRLLVPTTWTVVATGLVMAAGYLAVALHLQGDRPSTSFDPYARVRAAAPEAPIESHAWLIIREAMTFHIDARFDARDPWQYGASALMDPADRGYAAAEARDREMVALHAGELARLREAAARPVLGWPIAPRLSAEDARWFAPSLRSAPSEPALDAGVHEAPLPHLWVLRDAAVLLSAEAHFAAEAGDGARATDNMLARLGLARLSGESAFVIAQMVQSSIISGTATDVLRLLVAHPEAFSDAELLRMHKALESLDPAHWRLDLTVPRITFEDMVQRSYTAPASGGRLIAARASHVTRDRIMELNGLHVDPPSGIGSFLAAPLTAYAKADRAQTLARAEEIFLMIEADAGHPISQRTRSREARVEWATDSAEAERHPLIGVWMPQLISAAESRAAARTQVDGAIVALSLERHRRRTGQWPPSHTALIGEELSAWPLDARRGEPLHYLLIHDAPMLRALQGSPAGGDLVLLDHGASLRE